MCFKVGVGKHTNGRQEGPPGVVSHDDEHVIPDLGISACLDLISRIANVRARQYTRCVFCYAKHRMNSTSRPFFASGLVAYGDDDDDEQPPLNASMSKASYAASSSSFSSTSSATATSINVS